MCGLQLPGQLSRKSRKHTLSVFIASQPLHFVPTTSQWKPRNTRYLVYNQHFNILIPHEISELELSSNSNPTSVFWRVSNANNPENQNMGLDKTGGNTTENRI